jgi:hypothetical protein
VGSGELQRKNQNKNAHLFDSEVEKSITPKVIFPQMPQVEDGVRIVRVFCEMVLGSFVGMLRVADEHRREKYDWACGSDRVVAK